MNRTTLYALVAAFVVVNSTARAQLGTEFYRVENVETPPNHTPEVSAIAFDDEGTLYAALRLGTIWKREAGSETWTRFASGLHWPLGILPRKSGEILVAQLPELTRISDTDGDGSADSYETVCDAWGLGGNYHEFIAGPVPDGRGSWFISLGLSSAGGIVRPPFRGPTTTPARQGKIYGHHSPVPWRGWVVRVSPDGTLEPIASGFRQPNGLVLDAEGELFSVDNQGDWVGTSPLHHVTKGAFHGHPASLVWDRSVPDAPKEIPLAKLDAMRKKPAVLFPHNDLSGSITAPIFDTTRGRFGPFTGQLFVADWSHARVHRVVLEEVDGVQQGACFPFLDGGVLRRGHQKSAWSPKGELYLSQVSKLWGGTGEGLQRVQWTGKTPMDVLSMRLLRDGFRLEFTLPVDEETLRASEALSVQRYRYKYHKTYGSPKVDVRAVKVLAVEISENGKSAAIRLEKVEGGFIYDVRFRGVRSKNGLDLGSRLAAYTVNRLVD